IKVRCEAVGTPVSFWIRVTSSPVVRRPDPPAPKVTVIKFGLSNARSCTASIRAGMPSSVLGGNISKLKVGWFINSPSLFLMRGLERMKLQYHRGLQHG